MRFIYTLLAYLLAPIVRDRKGEYRKEFQDLLKRGFQRVKVNGEFHDLDAAPTLDKKFRHNIDVVVDRIVVREGLETRLADSLRTALTQLLPDLRRPQSLAPWARQHFHWNQLAERYQEIYEEAARP